MNPDPLSESYRALVASFRRKLLAENKSPRTIQTYGEGLRLFDEFLVERGMPLALLHIRREHVEAFITDLLAQYRPATAANRYRTLNLFFAWCVAEGEITRSPMQRMQPPVVPIEPPAVLTADELRRLFKACQGTLFRQRRNMAILRLFVDTGMRVAELAGIQLEDLDREYNVVAVLGKAGGAEIDLMQLAGWHSRTMLARYGASAAAERAREAHRRLALGDRF